MEPSDAAATAVGYVRTRRSNSRIPAALTVCVGHAHDVADSTATRKISRAGALRLSRDTAPQHARGERHGNETGRPQPRQQHSQEKARRGETPFDAVAPTRNHDALEHLVYRIDLDGTTVDGRSPAARSGLAEHHERAVRRLDVHCDVAGAPRSRQLHVVEPAGRGPLGTAVAEGPKCRERID